MIVNQSFSNKNSISMKNAVLIFFITLILTGLLSNFLPWWVISVVAFGSALLIKVKPVVSFFIGFLAIGLLWGFYSGYLDAQNNGLLSSQLGQIFNGLSSMGLILTTAIIGGLVGGLSAMTGSLLRKIVG